MCVNGERGHDTFLGEDHVRGFVANSRKGCELFMSFGHMGLEARDDLLAGRYQMSRFRLVVINRTDDSLNV